MSARRSLKDHLKNSGATGRRTRVRPNDMIAFGGGLNLVDPPIMMKPGHLLGCKNYEPGVRGGYSRVEGYERFDGRASPTRADYWALSVTGVVGVQPFPVGGTLNQYPTGDTTLDETTLIAQGTIVFSQDEGDGEWIVGVVQAANTPDFVNGFETDGDVYVETGTGQPGALQGPSSFAFRNGAPDDDTNELIIFDKTEHYRDFIEPVGGALCSGPVRDVMIFEDKVLAIRDSADGTQGLLFQTNDDPFQGWQQVDLGTKVRFTNGEVEIAEGDTVNGVTSLASFTAKRICLTGGTWSSGDAEGFVVTDSITGTLIADETLAVGGVSSCAHVSNAAQTLSPGGVYRRRVHNFAGAGDQTRLYGVNGLDNAYEFDGETFVQIETGMAVDKPTHLFVINNHLGLVFPGGSVQNSGFQAPLSWDPVLGASERSVGGEVLSVIEETTNTVFIATRNQTYVMSGTVMENFRVDMFSPETGMLKDSAARLGQTIFLDDRGFTTLRAVQAFGNFSTNSVSDKILTLLQAQIETTDVVGAVISRRKNLYRCFFDDGTGLVMSSRPGNKLSGWTVINYPDPPTCLVSGEVAGPVGIITGQEGSAATLRPERIFMGSSNGYVYECDIGNSFDGANIEVFGRMAYHHSGSPDVFKHYRKGVIDVDVNGVTTLFATVDFNYGNRAGQSGQEVEFLGGGGFWDVANWDEFKWSGQAFDQVVLKIEGDGYNIGLFFYGNSNREPSHTLYNVTYHSSLRKINRGSQGG